MTQARDQRLDLRAAGVGERAPARRAAHARLERREAGVGPIEQVRRAARTRRGGGPTDEAGDGVEAAVDRGGERRADRAARAERGGARGVELARDERGPREAGA